MREWGSLLARLGESSFSRLSADAGGEVASFCRDVDDVLWFSVPIPVPVPDVVVMSTPVAPASGGKQVKHEMGST